MLFLLRLYTIHLLYRVHWLLNLVFRRRSLQQLRADSRRLLVTAYGETPADLPYRDMLRQREFSLYSQNGEDGILLFLFSQVGTTNKTLVEFGVESGRECNAANLLINFGWNGLLMDGSESNMARGRAWYRSLGLPNIGGIELKQAFVTTDNINQVIGDSGIRGEIDLLSVDIDGNDYWVWQAIDVIRPRVVVAEYNSVFGPERSLTVNYDPAFTRYARHRSGWYHGASITALAKLGRDRGYTLVASESKGCNVFFVRDDLVQGKLQALAPADAFYPQPKRLRIAPQDKQFEVIRHLPLTEI